MDDETLRQIEAQLFAHQSWFDKNGRPITSFLRLVELDQDPTYRAVGFWRSDDEAWEVSTVWLGMDHSHGRGEPLIFETMAFYRGPGTSRHSHECMRYHTLAEAERGHEQTVKCLKEARAPFDWIDKPYEWL